MLSGLNRSGTMLGKDRRLGLIASKLLPKHQTTDESAILF